VKIAVVIERMDLRRGGRERSTAQVSEALARCGHDVTILCREGSWESESVDVVRLGGRGTTKLQQLTTFVEDVAGRIEAEPCDIVHAMLPLPGANVYQLRSGTMPGRFEAAQRRRSGVKRWLGRIGDRFNAVRAYRRRLEQQVMADAGVMCVPVSEMVAGEIERYYGRSENIRVVYNAVATPDPDAPERAEWRRLHRGQLGLDEHALVFLTAATNFELKGVAEAIEAYGGWRASGSGQAGARLVVVGREAPSDYVRLAEMAGVGDEVVFVPPVEDLFEWYAAADGVVLLSWYDPCSRVILEAIRWGIPSITTTFNGAAERLGYGAGVVVEGPRDVAGVVAGFERISGFQSRAEMSVACREASRDLDIGRHVDSLLDVYEDILDE